MIEFHCSAQFLNAKYPHPHLKIALQFCEDPLFDSIHRQYTTLLSDALSSCKIFF